jgi:hypothetical protein
MIIYVLVKQVKASTNIHYLNQLPHLHHFREITKIRCALLPEFNLQTPTGETPRKV